ncbi:MAG: TetR/AcrR family transcriptional regulator [Solirubrobacteraceae bacterium]
MSANALDEELLAAGRRAIARFGYQGATVERIAAEAGLSRVTLHRRGVSKDVILAALSAAAIDRYRAAMWPSLTSPGTARARMEMALNALCGAAENDLELLVALRAQSDALFHEVTEGQALTRDVFTEPLERLLRDGDADGTLRAQNPAETATVLFNLVGWTYVHLRTGHRWEAERARRATVEIALCGVAQGPP